MIFIYGIVFFAILYYLVRDAVEEGALNALIEYDRLKSKENDSKE